jgi:NTP pyrophosphatase (non-canonical NTP hydrolase)
MVKHNIHEGKIVLATEQETTMDFLFEIIGGFMDNRQLMKVSNTPAMILRLLSGEIDELLEAMQQEKEFIELLGELGDVAFYTISLARVLDLEVSDILVQNGKAIDEVTVADFRQQNTELAKSMLLHNAAKEVGSGNEEADAEVSVEKLLLELRANAVSLADLLEDRAEKGDAEPSKNLKISLIKRYLHYVLVVSEYIKPGIKLDVALAIILKFLRNIGKHAARHYNQEDLTFQEARQQAQIEWESNGGDEVFYEKLLKQQPQAILNLLSDQPAVASAGS